jgi:hypothetical protein
MTHRLRDLVLDMRLDHNPTECGDCAMHVVRCLMTAMRKPTEAMITAGAIRWHEPLHYGETRMPYLGDAGALVWERAIDAALK